MDLPTYPGGKAGGGRSERIGGMFPPHRFYFEPYVGHGGVMRRKSRARFNYGSDANEDVVRRWNEAGAKAHGYTIFHGHALETLQKWRAHLDDRWVIYLDPPYPLDTRTKKSLYGPHEMSDVEHQDLLNFILTLPCHVAISSYWNLQYAMTLASWRMVKFPAMTRGGIREECVWLNFEEPTEFHDPLLAHVGWRERQRVQVYRVPSK